jgi:chromosome segregation ATPase
MLEPDPNRVYVDPARGNAERHGAWLPIATATALVLAVGALLWAFLLQQRLTDTEEKLAVAEQGSTAFSRRLEEADARIRANSANVDQQLTAAQQRQQDLAARAAALAAQQRSDAERLAASQADTTRQLGAVKGEVSSVKTDVASTKTDVAATRTDLADTKQILQRTVGDAGVMSGLIAKNHDELEVLKHRGDRSYYEFTLHKNAPATLLSTVKLQLKKTNEKKGRYTLMVSSDDRNIEKKDKTVLEPVQFYSGKDPQLFEVVVNSIGKDVVGGYLSVPKGQ